MLVSFILITFILIFLCFFFLKLHENYMCVYRTGMMPPKYIYNIFKLITADLLTYFYTHPIYSLKSDFYYNFICFFALHLRIVHCRLTHAYLFIVFADHFILFAFGSAINLYEHVTVDNFVLSIYVSARSFDVFTAHTDIYIRNTHTCKRNR